MRTLILENDVESQGHLKHILTQYCHNIEIVGMVSTVASGIKSYESYKPELIILEIDLGDENGFDFLSTVDHSRSISIIVSRSDKYGFRAIKASVFDYFLKPYTVEELYQAVNAAKNHLHDKKILYKINASTEKVVVEINDKKFIYKDSKGIKVIDSSQLSHISVNKPYCQLSLSNGSSFFIKTTLATLLDQLSNSFFRIHKSHAVNIYEVQEWSKGRGGNVIMKNKHILPISYRMKKRFIHHLKQKIQPISS